MGERHKCVTTGRNSSKLTTRRYWAEGRLYKRRIARIERHIAAHPNDLQAPGDLRRIEDEIIARPARPLPTVLPGTPKAAR